MFKPKGTAQYAPLDMDEERAHSSLSSPPNPQSSRIKLLAVKVVWVYALILTVMYAFTFRRGSSKLVPILGHELPMRPVIFAPDTRYTDISDPAWESLIPPGKGFIAVNNPKSHGLSGGFPIPGGNSEGYSLSVFHQIHCLALLDRTLRQSDLAMSSSPSASMHSPPRRDTHVNTHGSAHVAHCVDYLRQAIMCAADTTPEKARVVNGTVQQDTDGWGVVHQCRDWDEVYEFAKTNRAFESEGII
ncbi:hypothetical protein BO71DRAFT_399247 [Aspergillus ellipticus CBS 707.79]|uniref:Oxidase ustYa n=1 Tax=Aspergillus ellipticus CBS 707.79 TaxID=1448320 RepID=A0A319E0I3_9EURO|nr:hypothetical protein BO71DRAFT_399247 [Aspergillus ellipticus CBS 707.79]